MSGEFLRFSFRDKAADIKTLAQLRDALNQPLNHPEMVAMAWGGEVAAFVKTKMFEVDARWLDFKTLSPEDSIRRMCTLLGSDIKHVDLSNVHRLTPIEMSDRRILVDRSSMTWLFPKGVWTLSEPSDLERLDMRLFLGRGREQTVLRIGTMKLSGVSKFVALRLEAETGRTASVDCSGGEVALSSVHLHNVKIRVGGGEFSADSKSRITWDGGECYPDAKKVAIEDGVIDRHLFVELLRERLNPKSEKSAGQLHGLRLDPEIRKRIEDEARSGDSEILCLLGEAYEFDLGGKRSEVEALRNYESSAQSGLSHAKFRFARLAVVGSWGTKDATKTKARKYAKEAADWGHRSAQVLMGRLVCWRRPKESEQWLRRAIENKRHDNGGEDPYGWLASRLIQNAVGKDLRALRAKRHAPVVGEVRELLKLSLEANSAKGHYLQSMLLKMGIGSSMSLVKARKHLGEAAMRYDGDRDAQTQFMKCLRKEKRFEELKQLKNLMSGR